MSDKITYEQPLNERVRALLRLEFLFSEARRALQHEAPWASRYSLQNLVEIQDIALRPNLKPDLLRCLEHKLSQRDSGTPPHMDHRLDEAQSLVDRLCGDSTPIGQALRDNPLLEALRQRRAVSGGAADFEIPELRYWLLQPADMRARDVRAWLETQSATERAVALILDLARSDAKATTVLAERGFYHEALDSAYEPHLVRVGLPPDTTCYPEISGSSKRITLRLLAPGLGGERSRQIAETVPVELAYCRA